MEKKYNKKQMLKLKILAKKTVTLMPRSWGKTVRIHVKFFLKVIKAETKSSISVISAIYNLEVKWLETCFLKVPILTGARIDSGSEFQRTLPEYAKLDLKRSILGMGTFSFL